MEVQDNDKLQKVVHFDFKKNRTSHDAISASSSSSRASSDSSTLTEKEENDVLPESRQSMLGVEGPPVAQPETGLPVGYDPNRIPSSIFNSRTTNPMDWSTTSNESLFSIHMGNNSFSRDHAVLLYKSGELMKLDEVFSVPTALPPLSEASTESDKASLSSISRMDIAEAEPETPTIQSHNPPLFELPSAAAPASSGERRALSAMNTTKSAPPAEPAKVVIEEDNKPAARTQPMTPAHNEGARISMSLSTRSRGSAASTGSFAFPVLGVGDMKNSSKNVETPKEQSSLKLQESEPQPPAPETRQKPSKVGVAKCRFYAVLADDSDQTVLMELKNSLSDPSGLLSGWNSSASHCSRWLGVSCDSNNRVSSLNITGDGAEGLKIINLAGNSLNGSLPGFIGQFKSVYLAFNEFTGSVPNMIGKSCSKLEHLDLSGNFLGGQIPSSIGSCVELRSLLLYSNMLEGIIPPELGQLNKLDVLDLSRNALSGALPVELGDCTSLSVLVLSNLFDPLAGVNGIEGGILLREMGSMYDEFNYFQGELPIEITKLPKLKILWAPRTNLLGSLPKEWGVCNHLEMINLAHNFFTGEIPRLLGNCKKLLFFDLSSNKLNGKLHEEIQVPCMTLFDVSGNSLTMQLLSISVTTKSLGKFLVISVQHVSLVFSLMHPKISLEVTSLPFLGTLLL
ncbi:hypothetical protein SAY87_007630 [Trapa incisa]|uniref:Leucine-rich repeat-containing N-terminal plant-type domain-containing protein n=1 Tax=Trapa incisa TaxID=236973 RepID=A0AAN7KBW1_9MYRT|nr:hypothetical protein SAY87_007630 [Trapa incisa]